MENLKYIYYQGIMLTTEDGVKIGESKIAAREGISQVVLSRIGMASPGRIS